MLTKIKNFFKIDKSLFKLDDGITKLSLFALAIPLFIESMSVQFVYMIQTMLSSNFMDGYFVTITGIVGSVFTPFSTIASMISVGMAIILSINLGRKRYDECKKIVGTAICADMFFCIIFYLSISFFSEELILFMGYSGEQYAEKLPYAIKLLEMRCFANILTHVPIIILAVLRCYGYTKVGLFTNLVSTIISTILTYIMFYVIVVDKENVLNGLVIVQIIAGSANVILSIAYFIRKKIPVSFRFNFRWCKTMVKLGVPATIANLVYSFSSILTTKICISVGADAYESRIYISQLVFYVYTFGQQLAYASKIMTGRLCGMGKIDVTHRMHVQNAKVVATLNGIFSLAFACFAGLILKYGYSASASIIALSAPIFFVDVIVEVGRGLNHVGQSDLNATGDVMFTTIISIAVGLVTSVGLAYILAIIFDLGLLGIWIAYAADEIVRATIYLVRWCRGGWRKSFQKELKHLEKAEQPA